MSFFEGFFAMSDTDDETIAECTQIDLPDEYLTMIGKVCVQWGNLEAIVNLSVQKLLGFNIEDARSVALLAHMTWPLKIDVLRSLVDWYREENAFLNGFDEVMPMLAKAQQGRNKVLHASWYCEDGETYIYRVTARGKLKADIQSLTADDLARISDDIGKAGPALFKVVFNAAGQ